MGGMVNPTADRFLRWRVHSGMLSGGGPFGYQLPRWPQLPSTMPVRDDMAYAMPFPVSGPSLPRGAWGGLGLGLFTTQVEPNRVFIPEDSPRFRERIERESGMGGPRPPRLVFRAY